MLPPHHSLGHLDRISLSRLPSQRRSGRGASVLLTSLKGLPPHVPQVTLMPRVVAWSLVIVRRPRSLTYYEVSCLTRVHHSLNVYFVAWLQNEEFVTIYCHIEGLLRASA